MTYNPHARAKVTPDPYGRQIGESYRDACERMLAAAAAQLSKAAQEVAG